MYFNIVLKIYFFSAMKCIHYFFFAVCVQQNALYNQWLIALLRDHFSWLMAWDERWDWFPRHSCHCYTHNSFLFLPEQHMYRYISLGKFLAMCGNNWGHVMKDNNYNAGTTAFSNALFHPLSRHVDNIQLFNTTRKTRMFLPETKS